jgi:hypothetical protein
MKNPRNEQVSPLTKVLIDKVHGGRKKDSKFWQSEFAHADGNDTRDGQIEIEKPVGIDAYLRQLKARRAFVFVGTVMICVLFGMVSLRPDLFQFLSYKSVYNTVSHYFPDKSKPLHDVKERTQVRQPVAVQRPVTSHDQSISQPGQHSASVKQSAVRQQPAQQWLPQKEIDQIVQPTAQKQLKTKPVENKRTLYEIELHTGQVILTDHAMATADKVSFENTKGSVTTINKYEVKQIKRLQVDE